LAITYCAEAYVTAQRLKKFLLLKATKATKIENDTTKIIDKEHSPARIHNVRSVQKGSKDITAAWIKDDGESTAGLSSINFDFASENLYAINDRNRSDQEKLCYCMRSLVNLRLILDLWSMEF
jgi:hypothetical protein